MDCYGTTVCPVYLFFVACSYGVRYVAEYGCAERLVYEPEYGDYASYYAPDTEVLNAECVENESRGVERGKHRDTGTQIKVYRVFRYPFVGFC